MVSIFLSDGTKLYQWDSNRQIQIIGSNYIEEVHFCHRNDKTALVVKPVIQNNFIVADIPNVLLQSSEDIVVYLYAEERTIKEQVLRVQSKNRPDDYVYEQTEILRYETLDKRLTDLEETLKNVVLKENDPTVPEWAKQPNKPKYTAEEVGALSADIEIPSIEGLAKSEDLKGLATEEYVNTKVAELVNSAPSTLDTIGELATAFVENKEVVEALNKTIANKANAFDLTAHTNNTTIHVTAEEKAAWNSVEAIIDVVELPTEDIKEDSFYRLLTGSLVFNQFVQNNYTCYCVEVLPETGEPATNADNTEGNVYYNLADGELYGYVDEMLSIGLNVPAGWYPVSILLGALGYSYNGVITDIMDDPRDGTFRFLLEYEIYSYKKGKWISHIVIGWRGTGTSAEIFNHPSNIASGDASHAEGSSSHAEGYGSHAEGDSSHAEGHGSHAEGQVSHAEGVSSHAEGSYSHAEGYGESWSYNITGEANTKTYTLKSSSNLNYLIIGASVRYRVNSNTYNTAKIVSID